MWRARVAQCIERSAFKDHGLVGAVKWISIMNKDSPGRNRCRGLSSALGVRRETTRSHDLQPLTVEVESPPVVRLDLASDETKSC